jgi:nucleoid DNA-binding protein
MTYEKLLEKISKHSEVSSKDVDKVLKVFRNEVKKAILDNDSVSIPNFGGFEKGVSNPRPKIGKPNEFTKESFRCKFTSSKTFKKLLNS